MRTTACRIQQRILSALLALALLVLAAQPHVHARVSADSRCVACAVHQQRCEPPATAYQLAPPILIAVAPQWRKSHQPYSLPAPRACAQGPPRA